MTRGDRHALVFGASGFLGKWLTVELASQGVRVTAAVRSVRSADQLHAWLAARGVEDVPMVVVDFARADLGLASDALRDVSEIHNVAGAYRFGMSVDEARTGNVVTAQRIVSWAAQLSDLDRLVHVSGYRVGSQGEPLKVEVDQAEYARLGAYEASKIESDRVVQATARAEGVPFTIINPSTVIGVSSTGESDQQIGLTSSLRDLWLGKLAGLPGTAATFVPVVTVDYTAKFMALVPTVREAVDQSYWVLDDDTPGLPDLLAAIGRHYQVAVPRLRIPVGLVRRLPAALTKADPETLSFMSTDRYPTTSARALASKHGLQMPETLPSILRWADHVAAHRFGIVADEVMERSFSSYAGIHAFGIGDVQARTIVLPPIPLNADSWAATAARMSEPVRVLDLPGLGMSAGGQDQWDSWLAAVADGREDLHLVGHSIGAAVAVDHASRHPGQIRRLTLVAPAFLQPAPGIQQRLVPLTAAFLRLVSATSLARRLLGTAEYSSSLETSVIDLRRPGVARRVGRILARGAQRRRRAALLQRLLDHPGEVHIIVGENDPLSPEAAAALPALGDRLRITSIAGAGHYPQITHPEQLLDAMEHTATVSPR